MQCWKLALGHSPGPASVKTAWASSNPAFNKGTRVMASAVSSAVSSAVFVFEQPLHQLSLIAVQ